FSAAGYFCKGTVGPKDSGKEITGTTGEDFNTDQMCWPTGFVLQEGRRYRITLTTRGDWFDRTRRANVAGLPSDSAGSLSVRFNSWMASHLRRWWGQNWLKPIARIGVLGNDEYVLEPSEPLDERNRYPPCEEVERATEGGGVRAKIRANVARDLLKCAPTP